MLAVKNVSRTFSNGTAGFAHVSFETKKGEIIGVLGTSGCGKSTLLRVLSGLDPGYSGEVKINGDIIQSVHEKVGVIFQESRLMPWLTVIENISFGLRNDKERIEKAQEYVRLVGLQGFESHYPKDISGGMAQRVSIARALITAPEVLLLDEPFSALDAFTKMQLQDLLLTIWNTYQSTMILVTHDIDEALYLCDRIVVLKGQPGEIYQTIKIEDSKPRSRGDIKLAQLKAEILGLLNVN